MIELNGSTLTLEQMKGIIYENEPIEIDTDSMERVRKSREAVEGIVTRGETVYGITTGFGKFSDVLIHNHDVDALQLHLIRSHACGLGDPFPEQVSKAMVVLRLNALLKGFSGVRPCVVERLRDLANEGVIPVVPSQGSLGASGDLAPLSHLALVLIGEGEVHYKGKIKSTEQVYQQLGYTPLTLKAKEGLALINGTQAMTAMGVINYIEAERILCQSDWIAAMTLEALEGIIDAFHPEIHKVRGYREQMEVAERIRILTSDSKLTTHQGEKRVQDAYSLRCIPQVHGASRQSVAYVKDKLEIEINAATDNPLILEDGNVVVSGGNFHGQPIALAMDFLKIAIAEMANISERRIERLVNPQLNSLPAFLSPNPGLQSGAMIMQYAAASLVSENKTLAHPASVDSIPSSANQEDHVSMGTTGARHAYQIILNAQKVLAIEFICAMQALEYRGEALASSAAQKLLARGREVVPSITEDRIFSKDIEALSKWLTSDPFDWSLKRIVGHTEYKT
ncbi:histidine ammonia-lyase [Halobacillus andaensis]|uniref:Histidine ammonia-lyase n=1 Tax=Halobacillus andaensis TaxID=1176239 RepID=A0A917B838_HALAA|nr:histidine ammonia-lyase [Halobacillus andaensis]MBP2005706.1 histidine ammonia-lyase [Halobacillus andaensis]GGF26609.1 histidine ammonia-lyase [Halobacillus andaensis]